MIGYACQDSSLMGILSIVKRILFFIQIIVPILLIIWGTISFVKMVHNPDEKNGIKKVVNQFLAAAVVFFVPLSVNVLMGIVGEDTGFSSCWMNADDVLSSHTTYDDFNSKEKQKIISDSSNYEKGESSVEKTDNPGSSTRTDYFDNVEGVAQLAVLMAGSATLHGEDAHIYSPTANPWCKVQDSRLYNEYRIMDEVITKYPNSCPNPNNLLCSGVSNYSYNNPAYASCAQAAAAVIRATVDPDFESAYPEMQLKYLQRNTEKWSMVQVVKAGERLDDTCKPGDLMITLGGLTHTMIYVGNEMVRQRFPESIGNVYQAGYSEGHARYPAIDYMDAAYADFYVFRPTGKGTFTYPFIDISSVLKMEVNWNNNQGIC